MHGRDLTPINVGKVLPPPRGFMPALLDAPRSIGSYAGMDDMGEYANTHRSVMSEVYAGRVAAFVNEHDDGTAQPRANVIREDGQFIVEVRSTEFRKGGEVGVVTERAFSLEDARALLGY